MFHIETSNEIVVNGANGGRTDFRNASRTQRDGVEFSVESLLPHGFEAYAAYTWLKARFTSAYQSSATIVPAGSRLPGVPGATFYGEFVWRHPPSGFHAAVEYRAAGRVFVNDANSDAAAGYGIVNVRAGFVQEPGRGAESWRVSEFVRVDNAGGRRYIGSVIVADANGRFFEPAPGRNVLAGVTVSRTF